MTEAPLKRKIAAILAADVAGYSRLIAEDEEGTLRRFADYRQVFDDFIRRAGGRIFNTAGDSVMCEFDSAVEAVRAAIDIQESLGTRNSGYRPDRRIQFRIGITIGDVVERGGDLLGDGVNIAARLESLAEPGGICVSRSVHEAVANKISVRFRDIGQRQVKNIPNRIHVFAVDRARSDLRETETESGAEEAFTKGRRRVPWLAGSSAVALLVVAVAIAVVFRPSNVPSPSPTLAPSSSTPAETAQAPASPAQQFAALARGADVVENPKTVAEQYHNARTYEARGDTAAARRAYQAIAGSADEFLDPHLRYAALLRAEEGRAGARQVYAELMAQHPSPVLALVYELQFDARERRAKIEAFASDNPDFAPAQYFLAEEHSEDRIGAQTLTERRLEFDALDRFLEAEQEGKLAGYFLDRSVLEQWLERARRRKAATEAFFQSTETKPTAVFARSRTGWVALISLPEPATAMAVRVGESGDFRPTGFSPALDQHTGKPAPTPAIELPADQERTTLYITYDDAAGRTAGPFPIPFDPQSALAAAEREPSESTR